jgi:superkiller protein 3
MKGRRRRLVLAAFLVLLAAGGLAVVGRPWTRWRGDPERAAALLQAGMQRRQQGDLRGAADAFRQAVAAAPGWADARLQLGATYMTALEYDLARQELERGVRLAPEDPAGWGQLGKLHLTTLQLDAAERALTEAIRLRPDRSTYVAMLGEAYRLRGDPQNVQAAVDHFRRALSLDPGNGDAYHRLGLAYQRLGRLSEAAVALSAATRAAPDSPQPYFALAQVERRRGRREAARSAMRTFRRLEAGQRAALPGEGAPMPSLDPETAALLEQGRRAFFGESEPEGALRLLQQARERAPRHPDVLYNLGLVLHFVGRLEEAEAAFRGALAADPKNPRYHAWIGTILLARGPGELEEAIAALKRSVELGPDYAYGHYQLGRALLLQNRPAEAASLLERAVARNPRYREAHYSLSQAYLRLGKRDAAREALIRFRQLDAFERQRRHLSVIARAAPNDPAPRLKLARFLAARGDREGAIRMLEMMTRVFPDYAPVAADLARLRKEAVSPGKAARR